MKRKIDSSTPIADIYPLGDNRYALNARNGIAPTLTGAHHYAGNITHPRQGFREMGVLEIRNSEDMEEAKIEHTVLGWTRDSKGKVVNRHPVEVANCVTASKRDNTQNYVCCAMSRRSENIAFKVMPNGNIRAYQTDKSDKRGVSELQFTNPENKSPTVITGNTIKVIEKMADQNAITGVASGCRIRKLTPRECFRLMGVDDADIDTIQASGISNSQQYKMAGNSIVVDVLYHIFRKLLVEPGQEGNSQTLF